MKHEAAANLQVVDRIPFRQKSSVLFGELFAETLMNRRGNLEAEEEIGE